MATKRIIWSLCLCISALPVFAERSQPDVNGPPPAVDAELLNRGRSVFPVVWNAYRPMPLRPVNGSNGPKLTDHIHNGKLALTLAEFLQLASENNLGLESARYTYLISQVDLLRARGGQAARGVPGVPVPGALFAGAIGAGLGNITNLSNFGTGGTSISAAARQLFIGPRGNLDPILTVNLSWDHVLSPLNSVRVAGISAVTTPSTVLQTRFQHQLPFGTSYSIDFNIQRQSSTQARIRYNPAYTSFFGVQLYQPLLNGAGRKYTQQFITLAENDRRAAYETVSLTFTDTTSTAANAYWDFVAFRDSERVAQKALELNQTIYDATKQRIDVGVQARIELVTAAAQVATSRRDLIIAQTNVQLQQVKLKAMISKIIGPEIAAIPLEPLDTLEGTMDSHMPDLDASLKTIMRKPPVRLAQISLENHQLAEDFTRDNLRPRFSLFAQFANFSLAPGVSDMFAQIGGFTNPEFSAGFSLDFTVKNRAAQADNMRARLERQQAEVALDQAKANMALSMRTSIGTLASSRSQVEAAQRATAASKELADAEQERWMIGVSTIDRVNQTQVDLVHSQMAEIQSRLNYAKNLMAAESADGSFLDLNGLTMDGGIKGSLWEGPSPRTNP